MKKTIATAITGALIFTGCATPSKDIAATPAPGLQYQPYDCSQLIAETQRIQIRLSQLNSQLDEAASHDKTIVGISAIVVGSVVYALGDITGLVLAGPIWFAVGGTKPQEVEYAQLKGKSDAIQEAAISKKCMFPKPIPTPKQVSPQVPSPKGTGIPIGNDPSK